jgi:hypothetical protein
MAYIETTSFRPAAPNSPQWQTVPINLSAAGNTTLIIGIANLTIKVMSISVMNNDPTNSTQLSFCDTSALALTGVYTLNPQSVINGDNSGEPLFTTSLGAGFVITSDVSVLLGGIIWYVQS